MPRSACLIAYLLLFASPASAAPLLFHVADADSELWLLGSVHALRGDDYPLDERIESAYRDAERVVLEVNPAELDPAHLARIALPLARQVDGEDLADLFSADEYARLRKHVASLGMNIDDFRGFEPWFVALQVFALNLAKSGYVGAQGVDQHFAARAAADDKLTAGLETAAEQFRMFDSLPPATQKAFLLESVDSGERFREELDAIVAAWRHGDETALTKLVEEEFGADPLLRDILLDARNRRWLKDVERILREPGDTLLVVGALHLVGDAGLVKLLRQQGYEVEKLGKVTEKPE